MALAPIFLERNSYRRRRVIDAVRLLPFLGFLLWMVPLLWAVDPPSDGTAVPASQALKYVFGVWTFLVGVGFVLWHRMKDPVDPVDPADAPPPDGTADV